MARPRKKTGWGAKDVIELLEREQGQVRWSQRYDPVSELVFTVLSQHTSDLNAERAFKRLRTTFGSWDAVASGDVGVIEECIRVGGLARVKAPRIKQLLNKIVELRGELNLDFLKGLPLDEAKAWLRQLPGIGPKTAAVVLAFSLGMPAMPVDTHVYRVSKRLGLINNKTSAEDAHEILEKMVAPEEVYPFHVLLITHGRRVCKAQWPLCHQCALAERCPSRVMFERQRKA